MKHKVEKYLLNHPLPISKPTILITGGTGSIGRWIVEEALFLQARIILGVRNLEKGKNLVLELTKKYPKAQMEMIPLDLNDLDSIQDCIILLKKYKMDYVIINSGVSNNEFHWNSFGIEEHFMINFYGPYSLIRAIHQMDKTIPFLMTCSISYKHIKTSIEDIYLEKYENINDLYSHSKRILLQMLYLLSEDSSYDIRLVHPGISYTELFYKRNNHGVFKLFLPIIKHFILSPKQAALNFIYAMSVKPELGYWIGPKGLFEIFGKPRIKKLKKEALNQESLEKLNRRIDELDEKWRKIYEF